MSKTTVLYNSINPVSNIGTIETISKSDEIIRYHNRWAIASRIELAGKISGLCFDFNNLIQNQTTFCNNFSQDFKDLQIFENNQQIAEFPYCSVESIDFDSDKYVRVIPFKVSILSHPQNLFSGVYGVLDPVSKISYQENDDSTIEATRNISARGFNTSSTNQTNNGFQNARNYVQSLAGWNTNNFSLPYFITYNSSLVAPCLKQQSENIDRFNNTYEVTEVYTWNKYATSSIMVKYSTESQYEEENGFYSVQIGGTIEGCPDDSIENIRNVYKSLDLYSIANYEFHKSFPGAININPEFLSDEITENTDKRTLSFSRSYDTDLRAPVMFDYEINIEYDVLSDIYSVSLNGTVRSRNSQKVKWERVLSYYKTVNIFNIVNNFYAGNGYPYQLVSYPLSYSVTENKFAGEISIQASWDNRLYPNAGFEDFNYTIDVEPSVNQLLPIPTICGIYTLLDLNSLKRAKITVNGEAFSLANIDKSNSVRTIIKSILNQYIQNPSYNRVTKSDSVTKSTTAQGMKYNFEYSQSYRGDEFIA